jgi:ubiquinol-cytochrome c reductase cytochrome b subunit
MGFLLVEFGLLSISLRDLYAVPKRDPSVVRGIALVEQFHCQTCHRIHGEGANLAPDLSFVADRRPDRNWHLQHFKDPQSVSPGSFMPKFPLNDQQLNDLTNYMLTLKSG